MIINEETANERPYPEHVLEKAKSFCAKKQWEAALNFRDSGHGAHFNAKELWENRQLEIDAYLALAGDRKVREYEFAELLKEIKMIVTAARQDNPHSDGLIVLENQLTNRLERWRLGIASILNN